MTKILFDYKFLVSATTVMVLSEYSATMKLIKLLQKINDRFDINNKPWKFCLGIFFNVKLLRQYKTTFFNSNSKIVMFIPN